MTTSHALDAVILDGLARCPMTERALARRLSEPRATVGAAVSRLVVRRLVVPVAPEGWHPVVRWAAR